MEWNQLLCAVRTSDLNKRNTEDQTQSVDHRTQFMRDYDRAIFSTPVRRLQDKTQVFPMEPHDAVRTRLTHSLEVSTVARDIAYASSQWLLSKGEVTPAQAQDIVTIAATGGLLHDIGNPPFGHSGEAALCEWFSKQGNDFFASFATSQSPGHETQYARDFLRIDGNAQTLRLISKLQLLADPYGLNLTCGTVSAMCKYLSPSHEAGTNPSIHERSKPGYFFSESSLINQIRKRVGTGDARNPITYLIEASDDIVYSVADIEDGIKTGAVNWETIEGSLERYFRDTTHSDRAMLRSCIEDATKLVEKGENFFGTTGRSAMGQAFRVHAISIMVKAVLASFEQNYEEIMAGNYHGELLFDHDGAAKSLVSACKQAAREHIYRTPKVLKLEIMGRQVIQDLMDIYWEGAMQYEGKPLDLRNFGGKAYYLMSRNYRVVFEKAWKEGNLPKAYCKMQLVADHVCGMTDTFAYTVHKEMTNG